MKKILFASFVAFCLVATGSAMAWDFNIEIGLEDAKVDVQATSGPFATDEGGYQIWNTAGVDGSGEIHIEGWNQGEGGSNARNPVYVWGEGDLYATSSQVVAGCCADCDCPDNGYLYGATQGATISGDGYIELRQLTNKRRNDENRQDMVVWGYGDFTAGMISTLAVEGAEPTSHAMGAFGTNVGFYAEGAQIMDGEDCSEEGYFFAMMGFYEGCCGDDDDDDDCGGCPS